VACTSLGSAAEVNVAAGQTLYVILQIEGGLTDESLVQVDIERLP